MFETPNPTLLDLLKAGATVTFPGGETLAGKEYAEPGEPDTKSPYIEVNDAGGKGPWAYPVEVASLAVCLGVWGLIGPYRIGFADGDRHYETLDLAKAAAQAHYEKTGHIVGIEEVKP